MSFVSAKSLEAQREERKERKRRERQEILEEAKGKFMKEREKQELRKERGDDKWIAPGVSKRLKLSSKGKKKHKKEKRGVSPVGEGTSDNEDSEWVVKGEESQMEVTPLKRDEWMTVPMGPSAGASQRLAELAELSEKKKSKREEEEKEGKEYDKPGHHPLELNPYWKDGGHGLPQREENISSTTSKVGDGGRSWLLRSYKRALDRCKEENISLESVAQHQWGSLEKLYSLLNDAGIDPKDPDGPHHNKRRLYAQPERDERRDHYRSITSKNTLVKPSETHFRSSKQSFLKPSDSDDTTSSVSSNMLLGQSDSQSWRKKIITAEKPHQEFLMTSSVSQSSIDESTNDYASNKGATASNKGAAASNEGATASSNERVTSSSIERVTDSQLNTLGAKLMKAEMLGNLSKVEKLKKELQRLRELKELQDRPQTEPLDTQEESGKEEKVIVLTKMDKFGNVRPYNKPSHSSSGRISKGQTHNEKGKRKKYFQNDDQYSLKSLMEEEKHLTSEDTYYEIARMASKFTPSTQNDETVDDALDSTTAMKRDHKKEAEKSHLRAVAENRKMSEILENCKYCFENDSFEKHLLIAVGINVYLALPSVQSLTEGHCLIIPMEHKPNSLLLDENVWSEINVFRKGLTRMFLDKEMDVIFMETYTHNKKHMHMFIECIPLPKEEGYLAPMYYKKAIQESDAEWSENKKLIDTTSKGVRGSLPVGLPYFFVEFGLDGGFAHVIEDQGKFPHYFGKEVCGGLLDIEPRLWLKPHRDSFEVQKEKVVSFSEWWAPYDWTQKLKEEKK